MMDKQKAYLRMRNWVTNSITTKQRILGSSFCLPSTLAAAHLIAECIGDGNKLLACGSGGSSSDSAHVVAEFLNRFSMAREYPLPAVDLSAMNSTITAIANDYSYDLVFAKQVKALGSKGDVLLGISTSGKSYNILLAIEEAINNGVYPILLTGENRIYPDVTSHVLEINVPSSVTPIIQESHIMLLHIICDYVDYYLGEVE
jgi:DnaA initiator-associating protein